MSTKMRQMNSGSTSKAPIGVVLTTVATQTEGLASTGAKKKKKKRKKKKKVGTESDVASVAGSVGGIEEVDEEDSDVESAIAEADEEDETVVVVVRSERSNSTEVEIQRNHDSTAQSKQANGHKNDDVAQLPLSTRLEKAAGHSDLKAGLIGLVDWSRVYLSPDVLTIFFESQALTLLLENFFRVCPVQDSMYENLTTLLSNLLVGAFPFHDTPSKPLVKNAPAVTLEAARIVVQSIRSIVDSIRVMKKLKETKVSQVIPQVAKALHDLIVDSHTQRLSLDSIGKACDLSNEISKMDDQLKAMAVNENTIRGQTIRDTFRRRDLRSEAINVSSKKLDKLLTLLGSSDSTPTPHLGLQSGSEAPVPALDLSNSLAQQTKEEASAIEARLSGLQKERQEQLAPLQEKKEKFAAEVATLKLRQAELRALLADVDARMSILSQLQAEVVGEMTTIENTFEEEVTRFGTEHTAIVASLQGMEKREDIVGTFRDLRSTLDTLSSTSILSKAQTSVNQHMDGVMRYASAQAICVQFMKNRIVDAETKRHKLQAELEAYNSLGANSLSDDLPKQIEDLSSLIEEDDKCLATLQRRDAEVRSQFEELVKTLESKNLEWNTQVTADIRKIFAKIFSVYNHCAHLETTSVKSPKKTGTKGWGTKDEAVPTRSMYEIQAEEIEDQITKENLARLEKGQRPTLQSELDKARRSF
ncbi:hypothetical protein AC1031_003690 [Aphanomyces cochlioides]|nr:hypothetical protein AC1031_003690 [Aphanomyces cochlioides]